MENYANDWKVKNDPSLSHRFFNENFFDGDVEW